MFRYLLPWLLWTSTAWAGSSAKILRVDGPMVYVASNAMGPLPTGSEVQVLQTFEAIDPKSGKVLVDRFPLGMGTVSASGETLMRIRVSPALAARVSAGDVIVFDGALQEGVVVAPPPGEAAPALAPRTPAASGPVEVRTEVHYQASPDALAFVEAFGQAATATREERLTIWRQYLQAWPDSSVATSVRAEVAALKRATDGGVAPSSVSSSLKVSVTAAAPDRVPERADVSVVLSTLVPESLRSATLYYRLVGEESYRHTSFGAVGDTTLLAHIPGPAVLEPGVEWFAEVRDDTDAMATVGGAAARPVRIAVSDRPDPHVIIGRSEVALLAEYVDFYAGSGADRYFHGESDFLYRIQRDVLYSMRVGAGTYQGRSGKTSELDELGKDKAIQASAPVGYNFGYTELEFRLSPVFAVMTRGQVGVDYLGLAAGMEGRIRLGREAGTSLDVGAARVGRIGARYHLGLAWNTVEAIPMAASVELTDLPGVAGLESASIEDYGVRLAYDARYAFSDNVELGARVGWALRNIDHAGPTAGLQAVFSW